MKFSKSIEKKMGTENLKFGGPVTKRKFRWKRNLFLIGMMALPVLNGILLDIFLRFDTLRMMFSNEYGNGFGFYWIKVAINEFTAKESDVKNAFKTIFFVAFFFNTVGISLQTVLSYFFYKKVPGTKAFRIIFYLPTLLSAVVTSLVFSFMFDNIFGPLTALFRNLGMTIPSRGLLFSPDTAMPMLMLYIIWISIGASTLMVTAAMLRIPSEITEAIRLDGANNFTEFFRFVIPLISPILSVIFLINMTAGFSLYAEIVLLTDPTQSHLYSVAYLITEGARSGKYHLAAGRGFVFTMVAIPLVVITRWILTKVLPDVSY